MSSSSAIASSVVETSSSSSSSSSSTSGTLQPSASTTESTSTSRSTSTSSSSSSPSSSSVSTTLSSVSTTSTFFTPSSSVPPSTTTQSTTTHPTTTQSTTTQSTTTQSTTESTTTQSTTSSQQGTPTTVTSSYTTLVSGSLITTQTITVVPQLSGSSSSSNRAAIIGGVAAGGTALLILILSLAFCARRKQFKRLNFLDGIMRKRKQLRSRATLFDVDLDHPPRTYTDYDTPWDNTERSRRALIMGGNTSGTASPTRQSRWSETGSTFKENVWPPPNESTRLMDPLANTNDIDIDLRRIVDDVMGPSSAATHFSDRSVSSMYRDSTAGSDGPVHSRTASNASNAMLLEAAGLGGISNTGLSSMAPVRSSPLAQPDPPGSVQHQSDLAS